MRPVSLAALFLALISLAVPAAAQTTNGVISGIVSDAQGGVLPGVTVTGRNIETGITRTVVTTAQNCSGSPQARAAMTEMTVASVIRATLRAETRSAAAGAGAYRVWRAHSWIPIR